MYWKQFLFINLQVSLLYIVSTCWSDPNWQKFLIKWSDWKWQFWNPQWEWNCSYFLPPSVFQSIPISSSPVIGIFFALYESITTGEATDIVGTQVLGAAVGSELLMISELEEPVRILLRKVSSHGDRVGKNYCYAAVLLWADCDKGLQVYHLWDLRFEIFLYRYYQFVCLNSDENNCIE